MSFFSDLSDVHPIIILSIISIIIQIHRVGYRFAVEGRCRVRGYPVATDSRRQAAAATPPELVYPSSKPYFFLRARFDRMRFQVFYSNIFPFLSLISTFSLLPNCTFILQTSQSSLSPSLSVYLSMYTYLTCKLLDPELPMRF